jgi:hypothetical protein
MKLAQDFLSKSLNLNTVFGKKLGEAFSEIDFSIVMVSI